jgi:hypothetical protein
MEEMTEFEQVSELADTFSWPSGEDYAEFRRQHPTEYRGFLAKLREAQQLLVTFGVIDLGDE